MELGALLENAVYNEFLCHGYEVSIGKTRKGKAGVYFDTILTPTQAVNLKASRIAYATQEAFLSLISN